VSAQHRMPRLPKLYHLPKALLIMTVAVFTIGAMVPAASHAAHSIIARFAIPEQPTMPVHHELQPIILTAAVYPQTYTVKQGDTLTAIAEKEYNKVKDWTFILKANHLKNTLIYAGQHLKIPAPIGRPPVYRPQTAPGSVEADLQTTYSTLGSAYVYTGGTPGGAFGACVVARESGGNAQIMNSTGHYGLYQFSESTWVEYGGNPADFGHATVAEQEQVFATALADGGESNWAPYDGC
jgi:LysM repeat protein